MVVDNTLMTQNVAVMAGTFVSQVRVRSVVAYVTDIVSPSRGSEWRGSHGEVRPNGCSP
jgi:hypothetical protein